MRYVAVGDSFTEGVGDEPDGVTPRGWADLVAAGLARAEGGIDYANLAVRGRLLAPIATDQVDAALSLDPLPDLITFNGGGNDMLRPGVALTDLRELIRGAVRRCSEAGIRVAVLAGADPSAGLPFGNTIRRRCEILTADVIALAADEGATMIDIFHDQEIRRTEYWSADRLHLNSIGHHRVSALVLRGLGIEAELPDRPTVRTGNRVAGDLRFAREHLAPWVIRRVRRQSSGDERAAKYPMWTPIPAPDAPVPST